MEESGSFTSLMAMVESHLSRTSVRESEQSSQGGAMPSFSLPNICSVRNTNSEQFLLPPPSTVFQLPRFDVKNSEITEVVAHQVRNMLVAKETALNEENEKQKLSDRLKSMKLKNDDDDYEIDLSASIIRPDVTEHYSAKEVERPVLSMASSIESLLMEDNVVMPTEPTNVKEEPLPLCDDMSYILYKRVKRGKCSVFGRVLGSRLRTVAAPYLHVRVINPDIVPFDFSTPSPCDVNKQRRLHPPQDMYSHMNMVDRFMAITKDEL